MGALERAIERFRETEGRAPRRLEELVRGGFLQALPVDPDGRPYTYDRSAGTVTTATDRVLGDS